MVCLHDTRYRRPGVGNPDRAPLDLADRSGRLWAGGHHLRHRRCQGRQVHNGCQAHIRLRE